MFFFALFFNSYETLVNHKIRHYTIIELIKTWIWYEKGLLLTTRKIIIEGCNSVERTRLFTIQLEGKSIINNYCPKHELWVCLFQPNFKYDTLEVSREYDYKSDAHFEMPSWSQDLRNQPEPVKTHAKKEMDTGEQWDHSARILSPLEINTC